MANGVSARRSEPEGGRVHCAYRADVGGGTELQEDRAWHRSPPRKRPQVGLSLP